MARRLKNAPKLLTVDHLDHRSLAYHDAAAKRDGIIQDLGGEENVSTIERMQAEHAAVGNALATSIEVRLLAGQPIPKEEREAATVLCTVVNTFNKTASAIGPRRSRDITPPTLSEVIAAKRRAAEDATASDG